MRSPLSSGVYPNRTTANIDLDRLWLRPSHLFCRKGIGFCEQVFEIDEGNAFITLPISTGWCGERFSLSRNRRVEVEEIGLGEESEMKGMEGLGKFNL